MGKLDLQSICENYVSCSLNHSVHNVSMMNPAIVIVGYACVISEEKNPLVEKCFHFWGHTLLNLELLSNGRLLANISAKSRW